MFSLWWQWWVASLTMTAVSLAPTSVKQETPLMSVTLSHPERGTHFLHGSCLPFLLSAKPPPARDWCARVIYGSDCQGLLKPIQFQDSGSHFLSFVARLMNSHYQLTCFIIVKLWLKWYFWKKKLSERKKLRLVSPHFPPLCPKLLCPRFAAPSFSLPVTCWPGKLISPLLFHSPVPAFAGPCILLIWVFSSPDGKSCWKLHFGQSF